MTSMNCPWDTEWEASVLLGDQRPPPAESFENEVVVEELVRAENELRSPGARGVLAHVRRAATDVLDEIEAVASEKSEVVLLR